jgi:hypothetical protein
VKQFQLTPPAKQLDLFVAQAIKDISRKPTIHEVEASYSGDMVSSGRVRKPFLYGGRPHFYSGGMSKGGHREIEAIELVPLEDFEGEPTTYDKKLAIQRPCDRYAGDYARSDPNGFYYGMRVKNGRDYVCGKVTAILVFEGEKLTMEIPWEQSEKFKDRIGKAA